MTMPESQSSGKPMPQHVQGSWHC